MKLILASNSPRRRELLAQAGFTFDVLPTDIAETPFPGEDPILFAERMAVEKAQTAARISQDPGAVLLAADTIVVCDREILGKPRNEADARRMLAKLSGRTHAVMTGYACLRLTDGAIRSGVETTAVTFKTLTEAEIEAYVQSGEPMDKAGAYAIQGGAGVFVERIEGSLSNVVGLPVNVVKGVLGEMTADRP